MRSFLPILALALAGCVQSAVPEPASGIDSSSAAAQTPLEWGLAGCAAAIAFVPVPAAAVAPHLPEGFRALAPSEAGLPVAADAQGDATVSVEIFSCMEAANATEAGYASLFVAVEPPADLKDPDAAMSFVKFDVLVADPALRAVLVAAGVPAKDGSADIAVTVPGAGSAEAELEGAAFAIRIAYAPTPPAPLDFPFVEYTATEAGLVTWKATAKGVSGTAVGVVEMAPGSLAAEITGAESAQAYVLILEGDFVDATIELPA